MATRRASAVRRPRARNHCRQFEGVLAGCARGGAGGLTKDHRALVANDGRIVCSINLDSCRETIEPQAPRWDYMLVMDAGDGPVIGMEVHHAVASEVPVMINKKIWALSLVTRECDNVQVQRWHWVVPNGQKPYFTINDPNAKALLQAGIEFPVCRLRL